MWKELELQTRYTRMDSCLPYPKSLVGQIPGARAQTSSFVGMCMSESTQRTSHFKSKIYNCSDSSSTVFIASHFDLNETKMQRVKDSSFCKQYLTRISFSA